jgi:single-strand DNA-binding protein
MYNRIILVGNLTKDPELRYTPQGTPVANLRIAVNSRFGQGENTKDETLFIGVVVIGKAAEACNQYLSKGSPVLVEGRLKESKWESDGQQKSRFEIVAQTVRFLSKHGKKGEESDVPGEETVEEPPF